MSLRASVTSELVLEDVRLPESAMLPEAKGLSGPLGCLNEARFGIIFGAMGAARDCLESAISYAQDRQSSTSRSPLTRSRRSRSPTWPSRSARATCSRTTSDV